MIRHIKYIQVFNLINQNRTQVRNYYEKYINNKKMLKAYFVQSFLYQHDQRLKKPKPKKIVFDNLLKLGLQFFDFSKGDVPVAGTLSISGIPFDSVHIC